MDAKLWNRITLGGTCAVLVILGACTAVIDPFFHYHKPLSFLSYPLGNQRYQNDGILRHFDYDAIIIGTSMTENFKASEFDRLWNASSVKVPFNGGHYKELDRAVRQGLKHNPKVKYVLRCLDYYFLDDKDFMRTDVEYPDYLYNENLFDDVHYLLNKEILLDYTKPVITYTRAGMPSVGFDAYSNWNALFPFGKEAVLSSYTYSGTVLPMEEATDDDRIRLLANLEQNVIQTAKDYPNVTFYFFFPPYSICGWEEFYTSGQLTKMRELEELVIETLLPYENIQIFGFLDCYDMICNLDNYKDTNHYGEWINSQILQWISRGEHRLTQENYQKYLSETREFYENYPYGMLHEE